ncbi:MAG: bis(5'-nucleosyl)-tetraphosphatase (symmetrical) YqeK, partial [Bacillota bacterium]
MLRKFTYFSDKISTMMSAHRYKHSLNVSETAEKLAHVHGADVPQAKIAGLLHDFARDFPDQKLVEIAENYNLVTSDIELYHPVLLHAPVGAVLVREEFDIKDPELLSAISRHTVGAPDMSPVEKVIYLADMI